MQLRRACRGRGFLLRGRDKILLFKKFQRVRRGNAYRPAFNNPLYVVALYVDFFLALNNPRPSLALVFLLYCKHFLLYNIELQISVRNNSFQLSNAFFKRFQLLLKLGHLKLCKPCQPQIEYSLRLLFGQSKPLHKSAPRVRGAFRGFDNLHNLVHVVHAYNQAL